MSTQQPIDTSTPRVIASLEMENVQKITALNLALDPRFNVLAGKNGAGKTSFLTGIAMALAGRRATGPDPIKENEPEASVTLDLGDITITRRVKRNGNDSLIVKPKDGRSIARPQELIDKLTQKNCFDPLAFANAKPAEQAETLRQITGLDFAETDEEIARLFAERTEKNREVKAQQAHVDAMDVVFDAPAAKIPTSDIEAKIQDVDKQRAVADQMRQKARDEEATLARYETALASRCDTLAATRTKIAELEAELQTAREHATALESSIETGRKTIEKQHNCVKVAIAAADDAQAALPDTADLFRQLEKRRADNALVDAANDRKDQLEKLRRLKETSEAMTKAIDHLNKEKARKLKAAKFPVEGLSFAGTSVFLHSVPLEQVSDAERIRVSVAVSAAQNPSLPVMFVRQGALLDDDGMQLLIDLAHQYGLQLLVERVKRDQFTTIEIVDGSLA